MNEDARDTFYFHLGINAGFFSEFNNMLIAVLYCLDRGIRFVLYSADANFRTERGWDDFFLPFCEETRDDFHSANNYRWLKPWHLRRKLRLLFEKRRRGLDYLTHDLWRRFKNAKFASRHFRIPELGIDGDLLEATRILHSAVWRYNPETAATVSSVINTQGLPPRYIGLHVRSGDKIIEHEVFGPERYMTMAQEASALRDVFVLTDDYRVFVNLRESWPDYRFYTTCGCEERGYFHEEYQRLGPEAKAAQLRRLFAAMDVLAGAELFVGTYSSNPGMNLGMRMPKERIRCVDYDAWKIIW